MSEQFSEGQLVAVRDGTPGCIDWHLRQYVVFDRKNKKHVATLIKGGSRAFCWNECVPAEEVWPELFFGRESETMSHMRRMRRDLGVKRRQVRWLSEQLDQINRGRDEMCDCPDPELRFSMRPMDCDPEGCAHCWEKASLKAVKEDDADGA